MNNVFWYSSSEQKWVAEIVVWKKRVISGAGYLYLLAF